MVATIANRGYFYKPHFVKKIQKDSLDEKYRTPNYTTIDSIHFEPVIEGMSNVVKWGTARVARVPGVEVCGKTGTVENFTKIDGEKVQLTDHSMFVAFAPRENPKIAVAVLLKMVLGWPMGCANCKPSDRKISHWKCDKNLVGKSYAKGSLLDEYQKPLSGKPFEINE
ncbi:MAG: hypothetical protein CM15mP83_4030 [Flavobacteriaceae bacterium]|nr:MAG: hypothetical protein CM15mP83_4030 [Flavobacteriaceae bacterium]